MRTEVERREGERNAKVEEGCVVLLPEAVAHASGKV